MDESGFSCINQNSDCSMNEFQDSVCSMNQSGFYFFHSSELLCLFFGPKGIPLVPWTRALLVP